MSAEQINNAGYSFRNLAVIACLCTLVTAGFFTPTPSQAQPISRVNANRLSCDALQDIVYRRGAVIVRSRSLNSGARLSERYVSNRRFCFQNEVTRFRTVATRDAAYCSVKLCTERVRRRGRR